MTRAASARDPPTASCLTACLLADGSVDRFAKEVSVAGMAGGFLDEVQQHPPEGEVGPVATRLHRLLVEARRVGYDLSAAITSFPVTLPQLLRPKVSGGAELPVGVGVPVHIYPGISFGTSKEADLHPRLLDQCQVVKQAAKGEI